MPGVGAAVLLSVWRCFDRVKNRGEGYFIITGGSLELIGKVVLTIIEMVISSKFIVDIVTFYCVKVCAFLW